MLDAWCLTLSPNGKSGDDDDTEEVDELCFLLGKLSSKVCDKVGCGLIERLGDELGDGLLLLVVFFFCFLAKYCSWKLSSNCLKYTKRKRTFED